MPAIAQMWRSEDSFVGSVLSIHLHVRSKTLTQVTRQCSKPLASEPSCQLTNEKSYKEEVYQSPRMYPFFPIGNQPPFTLSRLVG